MKMKFTNAALTKFFAENPNPKAIAWDTDTRSLFSYANKDGSVSLAVHIRVGSAQRKRTLGRLGEINLAEARKLAGELSVAARQGIDVIKERKQATAEELTFGHCYSEYMASLARKGASP